ncbi:MAG: hypothetical protein AAF333_00275 [Planctomycetota bacterium]
MSALPQAPTPPEAGPGVAPHDQGGSPPTAPPPPADGGSPDALTPEMRAQFAAAREAYRPLRRALRVVTFSAWSLAVFAGLSLPFALFSFKGLFIATGLTVCAVFEFRGRRALRRLDPTAPGKLALNQLVFTGFIAVYCLWSAATAWFGPSPYAAAIAANPEIGEMLEPFADTIRHVTVAAYGIVLFVGVVYQALVIRYYLTRRKPLERYLNQTPAWVLELHRP